VSASSREHHALFVIPPPAFAPTDLMVARNARYSCRVHLALTSVDVGDAKQWEHDASAPLLERLRLPELREEDTTHEKNSNLNTCLRPRRVPCRGCGARAVDGADGTRGGDVAD